MVIINGEKKDSYDGLSLDALVAGEGYNLERIAAEVNGEIVGRRDYKETILKDGDTIEVVSFVGGG